MILKVAAEARKVHLLCKALSLDTVTSGDCAVEDRQGRGPCLCLSHRDADGEEAARASERAT